MDDTRATNHEPSEVDRSPSDGAVPETDEADQLDRPTVDDSYPVSPAGHL